MKYKFFIYSAIFALGFSLSIHAGASLGGKLLQSNGKPLIYTAIELVPVDSDKQINDARLLATTGATGLFSFADVPPGKYTLSINFDEKPTDSSPYATFYYPNASRREEAEIFTVDSATKLKNIVFKLPPKLSQIKVAGKIVAADGSPVADTFVFLKDTEYDDLGFTFNSKTDKNGNFTLSGFESRRYVILALLFETPPSIYSPPDDPIAVGKTDFFTLDTNTAAFKITLKNTGAKSDVYE